MAKANKKKGKLRRKLTNKYRLVMLNEDTFEERFSIKVSRLNVYIFSGLFSVVLVSATIALIAFTPIREYIPGYSSTQLKRKATQLTFESDSLKLRLAMLENYTKAVKSVLTGEITEEDYIDSIQANNNRIEFDPKKLNATKEDSLFREKVEERDKFAISNGSDDRAKIVFFSPLNGSISQSYSPNTKHFAVDIVAKQGTPVKAVADGTVVFSEWTTETGYVIIVKHSNNFLSVYKHNGTLLKEQGDVVQSGEAIASVGSTGELTTGPHLHFELWSDGFSVNPLNYIDFQ